MSLTLSKQTGIYRYDFNNTVTLVGVGDTVKVNRDFIATYLHIYKKINVFFFFPGTNRLI